MVQKLGIGPRLSNDAIMHQLDRIRMSSLNGSIQGDYQKDLTAKLCLFHLSMLGFPQPLVGQTLELGFPKKNLSSDMGNHAL